MAHYAQGLIHEEFDGSVSSKAREQYVLAAQLDPGHHRLYAKAATALLLNAETDRAIALLTQSCKELPDSLLARVDLATAYQFAGRYEDAIRQFREALRLDPSRSAIYLTLANLYFETKRDGNALAILTQGLDHARQPQQIRAYTYHRGVKFIDDGDAGRSLPCLRLAVRHFDPPRAEIYYRLGLLYDEIKLQDEALQCFAWAVEEEPNLSQAYVRIALLKLNESVEASLKVLDQAEGRLPNDILIPLAKGQILSSNERYAEAIPAFARVEGLKRNHPELDVSPTFYLHYGAAYERCGDFARAEQVFEEGLRQRPDDHEVLNYIAYMWAERNQNLDRALQYAVRANQLNPQNGAYLDTLGWVYYRLGQYQGALQRIEAANKLVPEDPTIRDHLGDTWKALGDRDQAVEHWKASYLLDSANRDVASKLKANGVDPKTLVHQAQANPPAPTP